MSAKGVLFDRPTPSGEASDITPSDWHYEDVNYGDPVEVDLVLRSRQSAMACVASSTSRAYVGQWNSFVHWCDSRARPRATLPADDLIVAMDL